MLSLYFSNYMTKMIDIEYTIIYVSSIPSIYAARSPCRPPHPTPLPPLTNAKHPHQNTFIV